MYLMIEMPHYLFFILFCFFVLFLFLSPTTMYGLMLYVLHVVK